MARRKADPYKHATYIIEVHVNPQNVARRKRTHRQRTMLQLSRWLAEELQQDFDGHWVEFIRIGRLPDRVK